MVIDMSTCEGGGGRRLTATLDADAAEAMALASQCVAVAVQSGAWSVGMHYSKPTGARPTVYVFANYVTR